MAKKSFKDNPALTFISAANSLAELPVVEEIIVPSEPDKKEAKKPVTTVTDTHTHAYTQEKSESKALFPARSEAKSKRLQLLLRPSTYQGIANIARENGISVNETVNVILEAFVKADKQG